MPSLANCGAKAPAGCGLPGVGVSLRLGIVGASTGDETPGTQPAGDPLPDDDPDGFGERGWISAACAGAAPTPRAATPAPPSVPSVAATITPATASRCFL